MKSNTWIKIFPNGRMATMLERLKWMSQGSLKGEGNKIVVIKNIITGKEEPHC